LRPGKADSVEEECLTVNSRSHDVLEYTLQEWCAGTRVSGYIMHNIYLLFVSRKWNYRQSSVYDFGRLEL